MHYGILRRSGRYPWGSGEAGKTGSTRNRSFLDDVDKLKKEGMTEAEIARGFGITTTELRAKKRIAIAEQTRERIISTQRMKDRGWSNSAIARRQGRNESSVRADLEPGRLDRVDAVQTTANMLKDQLTQKKYLDIGVGVENQLGITNDRLKTAVAMLKEEGYTVHNIKVEQLGTGKFTTRKVLAPPNTTLSEVQKNRSEIQLISGYSEDHGRSYLNIQPPLNITSRRVKVNYVEDGGAKADGVIYVRPGVKDVSLGSDRYAQVRIAVDGTHYLKGMAVYKDDLPDGVDLVFNTRKSRKEGWKTDSNKISDDPDLPFGAIVRQIHGPDGKVSSAMNIVGSPTKEGAGAEGYWDTWSKNLSSQFLSKQDPKLAQQQLDLTFERRMREFNEINSLTNPTVRKELLLRFADSTDSAAVHLNAANMPRQATKVLLPIPSLKETEVYAPSMRDGERVALIRHPHGGTFEIPQLTVNNRNREARKIIGTNAIDAIGINHKVAAHLSGADFDGDTVLVIPNNRRQIKSTDPLEGLVGFDPHSYKLPADSPIPRISPGRKQFEMGNVSNLITDMTLHDAPTDELARAVRHSMVVIDSEKHGLDYKRSEQVNGILQLKEKYQGGKKAGASTLISRATSDLWINEKIPRPAAQGGPIDKVTGKKVYVETGRMISVRKRVTDPTTGKVTYVPTGKTKPAQIHTVKLAEEENAFKLSSGTIMEGVYAEHSNKLKALANTARKEALPLKGTPYSPSAKKVYSNEVASLNAKLNVALKNAPLERQAQALANLELAQKRQAHPGMEPDEIKKIKQAALNKARNRTGAGKTKVVVTKSEWDAIQAGAISTNRLEKIMKNSDLDSIKYLAMPRHTIKMTNTMKRRAQRMLDSGYTQIEVADQLGIGLTTLKVGLNE
jgi:DNA-binding CsgD family transcriptional regulator